LEYPTHKLQHTILHPSKEDSPFKPLSFLNLKIIGQAASHVTTVTLSKEILYVIARFLYSVSPMRKVLSDLTIISPFNIHHFQSLTEDITMAGLEACSRLLYLFKDRQSRVTKSEINYAKVISDKMQSEQSLMMATICPTWIKILKKLGLYGIGHRPNVEDGICGVTLTTATVEELGYGSEISPTPTVADDLGLYAFFSKYLKYQIIFYL